MAHVAQCVCYWMASAWCVRVDAWCHKAFEFTLKGSTEVFETTTSKLIVSSHSFLTIFFTVCSFSGLNYFVYIDADEMILHPTLNLF